MSIAPTLLFLSLIPASKGILSIYLSRGRSAIHGKWNHSTPSTSSNKKRLQGQYQTRTKIIQLRHTTNLVHLPGVHASYNRSVYCSDMASSYSSAEQSPVIESTRFPITATVLISTRNPSRYMVGNLLPKAWNKNLPRQQDF